MRMSHQEIMDEFKQTEGDLMIKARLRQIRQKHARNRMTAAVPDADVIITNPTHFAVAFKCELDERGCPCSSCQGARFSGPQDQGDRGGAQYPDRGESAYRAALYAGVEVDQEIPPKHFKAVAEIIGYVFRLNGKMPRQN